MKLDIDCDDDPHLRQLDGAEVEYYERFGDACYLVNVEGEWAIVAGHELADGGDS